MSDDIEKNSKKLSYIIEVAKFAIIIVGIILAVDKVQSDAKEERALMQLQINTMILAQGELKGKYENIQLQVNDHSVTMGKFEERLINIKDDTEQTLDLVREFTRNH